jgi:hypothetical protein
VHARVAWVMAGITFVLMVGDAVVSAQALALISETSIAVHGFPFVHGAVVGCSVMGALIVSRYDRHPIGWLLSIIGVFSSVSLLAEAYAYWVQEADGPGSDSLGSVAAWVSALFGGQLAIGALAVMFLIAPDGHLVSRRWRYAAWVIAAGIASCFLAVISLRPTEFVLYNDTDDTGLVRDLMLSLGFLTISAGLIASVVSLVLRMRRSTTAERQQLAPIALSAALIAIGIVCMIGFQIANGGQQTWLAGIPLFVAYFLVPILFATSVLRYRLYDIDVIINRTVLLVVGTAFAAVGYITLVVTIGRLVEGRAGSFWLSLLGIALVALAFQPLRRSVVRLSNRVAYGSRAQPYEALADFSSRLAEAPSAGTLLPAVAEAAARSVSAAGATATLEVPGSDSVSGTWGDDGPADHVVPVRTEGRDLGTIAVVLAPGRGLATSDLRLLEALADQTAVAFGNSALASSLAEHVSELDRTARRLTESRLRIVEADDAARRALETAIARDVLPSLASLPGEIRRTREAIAGGAPDGLDRLIAGTNDALEALRDLTRGVFPAQLERAGLSPALRTLVSRNGSHVTLSVDQAATRRFAPRVETAVYFCVAEASRQGLYAADLALTGDELVLSLECSWDGDVDLTSIADRVEAVGGAIEEGAGSLRLTIPVDTDRASALVGSPAGPGL